MTTNLLHIGPLNSVPIRRMVHIFMFNVNPANHIKKVRSDMEMVPAAEIDPMTYQVIKTRACSAISFSGQLNFVLEKFAVFQHQSYFRKEIQLL